MNPNYFVQNSLAKPELHTGAKNCARISQRFTVPCEFRENFFSLIKDISEGDKIFIHFTASFRKLKGSVMSKTTSGQEGNNLVFAFFFKAKNFSNTSVPHFYPHHKIVHNHNHSKCSQNGIWKTRAGSCVAAYTLSS